MGAYGNQEVLIGVALIEDRTPRKESPESEYPTLFGTYQVTAAPQLIVPHSIKRRRCTIRVLQNTANNGTDVVIGGSSSDVQNQVIGQAGVSRLNPGNDIVTYGTTEIWMMGIAGGANPTFVSVTYDLCARKP